MALEGTHIRFAVHVAEQYLSIDDMDVYIAGTVYPDSRRMTGLDRTLLHNAEIITLDLKKSDFELGMAVHVICDQLQGQLFHQHTGDKKTDYDRWWETFTALKVLQDMQDGVTSDVLEHLGALDVVHGLHGEDPVVLKRYHEAIQELYRNPLTLEAYGAYWETLLGEDPRTARLVKRVEVIQLDASMMQTVTSAYDDVCQLFDAAWRIDPVHAMSFDQ